MSDISLKDIVGQKKNWTDQIYDLLWESAGIAIACGLVWLITLMI